LSNITPRYVTNPFGVIEDAPICNAGVFRDLKQSYLFYYNLVLEYFESSIAEYQQYNVLNYSRKTISLTQSQDPVIFTAVGHQHTSDI